MRGGAIVESIHTPYIHTVTWGSSWEFVICRCFLSVFFFFVKLGYVFTPPHPQRNRAFNIRVLPHHTTGTRTSLLPITSPNPDAREPPTLSLSTQDTPPVNKRHCQQTLLFCRSIHLPPLHALVGFACPFCWSPVHGPTTSYGTPGSPLLGPALPAPVETGGLGNVTPP